MLQFLATPSDDEICQTAAPFVGGLSRMWEHASGWGSRSAASCIS
jgi:hypothetical protein